MNRSLNLAIAVLLLIGCVALTIAADKQEKKALEKVKVETRKDRWEGYFSVGRDDEPVP